MEEGNLLTTAKFKQNLRNRMLSGFIVIIPLVIAVYVFNFIYTVLFSNISPFVKGIFGELPPSVLGLLSVIILCLVLYIIGTLTTNVIGNRIIGYGEKLVMYIPIISTVYHTTKQVIKTLADTNKQGFRSVVLIEYPRPGLKVLAFQMGTVKGNGEEIMAKIMVPTSPNPTSGFLVFVPQNEVYNTNLSIEEGMKIIISGGILTPEVL